MMNYSLIIAAALFLLAVLLIPFFRRIGPEFLFLIPILNVISETTIMFFSEGSIHLGLIRAIVILVFVLFCMFKLKFDFSNKFFFLFSGYLFVLVFFSSNALHSFEEFLKLFIAIMMFPIASYIVKNVNDLKKLNKSIIISVVIVEINYILAQVFGLGNSPYLDNTFYMGGGGVQLSYFLAYSLLILPLMTSLNESKKKKLMYGILFSVAFILLVLIFRRMAFVAVVFGYFLYAFLTNRKGKIICYAAFIGLFIVSTFSIYADVFNSLRGVRSEKSLHQEARVVEVHMVLDEFAKGSLDQKLFGKELFNSGDYFVPFWGRTRTLHTDFAVLFHGAGLLGFILYVLLMLSLTFDFRKNRKFLRKTKFYKEINAVFWMLMAANVVISFSGQYYIISAYSVLFLYLGALNGVAKNYGGLSPDERLIPNSTAIV